MLHFFVVGVSHEFTAPNYFSHIIELSFLGTGNPEIEGLELLPHYHNYFIDNDSSKWATECRNYAQVNYTNIWEGIDLAYFFTPKGLKYEYYIQPHAKIEDIRIQVKGAKLSHESDVLHMQTILGTLKDNHLLVFGKDSGTFLSASFAIKAGTFSFEGIPSVRTETIVIDPLVYSTYLEGNNNEIAYSIAVDAAGCAYVTGFTDSSDFPMDETVGGSPAPGYDETYNGATDAFVIKPEFPVLIPILELSVSVDAASYREGDLPVVTVELHNAGNSIAIACEVLVTLPSELAFSSYQLIVSSPVTSNSRIFHLGNLPEDGSISFPLQLELVNNVPTDTSVILGFDASCQENATASATLAMILIHVPDAPELTPPYLRIWGGSQDLQL